MIAAIDIDLSRYSATRASKYKFMISKEIFCFELSIVFHDYS